MAVLTEKIILFVGTAVRRAAREMKVKLDDDATAALLPPVADTARYAAMLQSGELRRKALSNEIRKILGVAALATRKTSGRRSLSNRRRDAEHALTTLAPLVAAALASQSLAVTMVGGAALLSFVGKEALAAFWLSEEVTVGKAEVQEVLKRWECHYAWFC